MRRIGIVLGVVLITAACSGGGHSSAPPPNTNAGLEAARACRMWTETVAKFTPSKSTPDFAALDTMAAAIGPVANQASLDDQRWSSLALDVAGATDFKSAAIPDMHQRIVADCKAVPASAAKAVATEPDPFAAPAPTSTLPTTTTLTPPGPTTSTPG